MNDELPPLPEPVAWMIRNLVDTEVQPWPTRPDSEAYALASVHQGYECSPLYTADQLRAAVLAERESAVEIVMHELGDTGQARAIADAIRNGTP